MSVVHIPDAGQSRILGNLIRRMKGRVNVVKMGLPIYGMVGLCPTNVSLITT